MRSIPHVALLIETSNRYCRDLIKGITDFIQEHRCWSVYLTEHHRGAPVPSWFRKWKGDGIIARIENPQIAQAIQESGLPAVNVSSTDFLPSMPAVVLNEEVSVQLIVDHFLERGFQEFAFCGTARHTWSATREDLFLQYVQKAKCECHIFAGGNAMRRIPNWEKEQEQIAQWILDLPKPIGIFAPYDFRGQQVLDACLRVGATVPGQVAVASIGNDSLICELTSPPMSSISTNPHRAGYLAASVLDQLMSGEYTGPRYVEVEPIELHIRQSTDVIAIDDTDIASALQYIYQHACDGINVSDLLKVIPISRRKMEFNFKKIIGRTPREEILRVKLDHAKRLIASTELLFDRIAQSSGFSNASHLGEVFRRETGLSPSVYREQSRKHNPPVA